MQHNTPGARRKYIAESILGRLDSRPFVGGEFVDAQTAAIRQITDPFSQDVIFEMADCGAADIDRAISSARQAFDDGRWSGLGAGVRADFLRRLADLIDAQHDDLALLESLDVGKPITGTSGWDISNAATMYRYYADLVESGPDETHIDGSARAYQRREPVGVVAALVPWNFPFPCISWKVGPALASGCCVVVKSAERAPLSAQAFGRLVVEAGFPPGVVNIVMGPGASAGTALVADERVDAISFTGGTATASAIVQASAPHVPRLTLELGGKGPNLVWADADFEAAVNGTVVGMFDVAGQNCCAASRALVHEDIADDFISAVVEAANARVLGDQLDDATEQGPQIDADHVRHIDSFVQDARARGAEVLAGGGTSETLGGSFYAPTILDGVTSEMRVAREEVFGPVGCVFRVRDLDAAIRHANDSPFGLSASVWASDETVLERFVERSQVGVCWVNTFGLFDPGVPWGGTKMSGYGRELGKDALDAFTTAKTVYWETRAR